MLNYAVSLKVKILVFVLADRYIWFKIQFVVDFNTRINLNTHAVTVADIFANRRAYIVQSTGKNELVFVFHVISVDIQTGFIRIKAPAQFKIIKLFGFWIATFIIVAVRLAIRPRIRRIEFTFGSQTVTQTGFRIKK